MREEQRHYNAKENFIQISVVLEKQCFVYHELYALRLGRHSLIITEVFAKLVTSVNSFSTFILFIYAYMTTYVTMVITNICTRSKVCIMLLDKKSHVWSFQIWSCFRTGKISVAFIILATATALHICMEYAIGT